jgi:uncharacterized protein (DUF2141 family)
MKYALFFVAPFLIAPILATTVAPGTAHAGAQTVAGSPVAGSLTVTVDHVPDTRGHVMVAVCRKQEFLSMHCSYSASAPSHAGTVQVVVPHVAPGIYALQAWQDANDNGQIDRDALGIPTEPIGFSRDARMWFGPPRFADAAVQIGDTDSAVAFSLRGF